jgi:proline iminopeptidase
MKKFRKAFVRLSLGLIVLLFVLFFVFFFTTKGDYNPAQTVDQDKSLPHIQIGSTIFHAETYGNDSNETVIVVHGGPGNDYRYLLPLVQLSDKYRVIFYDQRGTGLSPRVSEEQLYLDTMLQDLENIIDYYSPDKKVSIIGHSWGAMLASGYLGKHPNRVRKIVLAEPGFLTSKKAKEFMDKTQFRFSFGALAVVGKTWFKSLHIDGPDDQAKQDYLFMSVAMSPEIPDHPFLGYFCNRDPFRSQYASWRYSALSATKMIEHGKNDKGELSLNLVEGVDSFKSKVLFISGECNTLCGPNYQKDHLQYFHEPAMVIIPEAGHMMFNDQTALSIQTVREYFEE